MAPSEGSMAISAGARTLVEGAGQFGAGVDDSRQNHQGDRGGDETVFDWRRAWCVTSKDLENHPHF